MSQLQMFGLNIWLLIGILTLLFFVTVGALVIYTSTRAWLYARAQNRSFAKFQAQRLGSDGHRKPPQGSGICRCCGTAVSDGYHTPQGCFCTACFDTNGLS